MSGLHDTLCNLCWAMQHRVKQNHTNSPRWILVYSTLNKPLILPHKFFPHSYSRFHQTSPTKILFFVSHKNRLNMDKFLKANLSLRPGDFLAWALEGQCISDFISYQATLWKWRSPRWNQEQKYILFEDHVNVWATLTLLGMEYLNANTFHFSHISKGTTVMCLIATYWKNCKKRPQEQITV